MCAPTIEQWSDNHARWPELVTLLEREDQLSWVLPEGGPLRPDAVVLVAHDEDSVLGFLAFIVQEIGPPDECPALGLTEAKVLAFGVRRRAGDKGSGAPSRSSCSSAQPSSAATRCARSRASIAKPTSGSSSRSASP